MFKLAKPLFLICETPLHVGSGDNLGIVDMPIQREKHTGFPKVESSSLKGSLRTAFEGNAGEKNAEELIKIQAAFGYDGAGYSDGEIANIANDEVKQVKQAVKNHFNTDSGFLGCLGFTDARILLFPVKSMKGVFAWITCPQVLKKFAEEMRLCERDNPELFAKVMRLCKRSDLNFFQDIQNISEDTNTVPNSCELVVKDKEGKEQIVLEEFAFEVNPNKDCSQKDCSQLAICLAEILFSEKTQSYWKTKLEKNLVVLSNDDFKDFVEHSTEVITRTKIDNKTGTVVGGALFTEEFLPAETIMYSLILATPEFGKQQKSFTTETEVIDYFDKSIKKLQNIFQLGGNATLGKRIMRMVFLNDVQTGEDKA